MMLRAMDPAVRLGACVRPFLVSIAVNNLLPFRAGDAFRVVGFRDELQAPPMRILGTMLVERLLDLSTLLVFFFIGLSGTSPGGVPPAFVTAAAWMAAAGAALVLTLLLLASRLEAISEAIARWPLVRGNATLSSIAGQAHHVAGVLGVLHTPSMTARLALLSFAAWLFEGLVFVAVALGLSIEGGPRGPLFALATGTLATLIPSSPGYVGTFDYFAALGLVAYGAPRALAAAFAIVVHLILWLPLTLAGSCTSSGRAPASCGAAPPSSPREREGFVRRRVGTARRRSSGPASAGWPPATSCAKRGIRVTIFESDAEIGGLAGSFNVEADAAREVLPPLVHQRRAHHGARRRAGQRDQVVFRPTRTGMYYANSFFGSRRRWTCCASRRCRSSTAFGSACSRCGRAASATGASSRSLTAAEWLRTMGGDTRLPRRLGAAAARQVRRRSPSRSPRCGSGTS